MKIPGAQDVLTCLTPLVVVIVVVMIPLCNNNQ